MTCSQTGSSCAGDYPCLISTVALITVIFYFDPSTKSATSAFRTVTAPPEINGRAAETFVELNQRVEEGQPLFRLDSAEQEAEIETARRLIAEIEAPWSWPSPGSQEADGRIVQARGALQQAMDEFEARVEANRKSAGSIAEREVERMARAG